MRNRMLAVLAACLALAATLAGAAPAAAAGSTGQNEWDEVGTWVTGTHTAPIDNAGAHYFASLLDEKNDAYCYSAGNTVERAHVADKMEWFLYSWASVHTRPNVLKVEMVYAVALDRDPDPAGEAYWLGQLNSGVTWQSMLDSLVFSGEFITVKVNSTWDASC